MKKIILILIASIYLIAAGGCGRQQPPTEVDRNPPKESAQPAVSSTVAHQERWAVVEESGLLLGFCSADGDRQERSFEEMADRLLHLAGDTEATRRAVEALRADREADAAPAFTSLYFELIHPRVEAIAKQYLWGYAMPDAELWQQKYADDTPVARDGGRITDFVDARVERLEPLGVFGRDGALFLVYGLEYALLPEEGTRVVCAGGMALEEDGWLAPGPDVLLILRLQEDGGLSLCMGESGWWFSLAPTAIPEELSRIFLQADAGTGNWNVLLQSLQQSDGPLAYLGTPGE